MSWSELEPTKRMQVLHVQQGWGMCLQSPWTSMAQSRTLPVKNHPLAEDQSSVYYTFCMLLASLHIQSEEVPSVVSGANTNGCSVTC